LVLATRAQGASSTKLDGKVKSTVRFLASLQKAFNMSSLGRQKENNKHA
jgi:hypothetical protein